MTFLQMRCFLSLSKTRKLSVTAALMGLNLSTLSKYISRMEDELSAKLFNKNLQQLTLTQAGELIYPSVAYIIKQHDDQLAAFYKYTSPYESAVNIALTFHQTHIIRRLTAFMQSEPKIKLSMTESPISNICTMLDKGRADIGIVYEQLVERKYPLTLPLSEDLIVVAVPENHPLANRDTVSLRAFHNETFYLHKGDYLMYSYLLQTCIAEGFAPKETPDDLPIHAIMANVSAGNGVTLLAESAANTLVREGITILNLEESPRLTLCAICTTAQPPEAIRKLIHSLLPESDKIGHKNAPNTDCK